MVSGSAEAVETEAYSTNTPRVVYKRNCESVTEWSDPPTGSEWICVVQGRNVMGLCSCPTRIPWYLLCPWFPPQIFQLQNLWLYECWLVIRSFSVCSEGRLQLIPPPPTETALQEELLFKCPVSLILEWEDSEGSVLYGLPGVPAGLSSSCPHWTLDSYYICYGHLSPFPFLSHFSTQLLWCPRVIFQWTTGT